MPYHQRKSLCPSFVDLAGFFFKAWAIFSTPIASALEFPEGGNFEQQSDFINGLTHPCEEETARVVTSIIDATNPFAEVDAHSTSQPNRNIKVWRHEFDAEHGVVFKRTVETAKEKAAEKSSQDTEEVMIGGQSEDGTMQPLTFRFQRGKDGLLKVVSKEKVKVTQFAAGVDEANKEGLVVRANTCYSKRLRDTKPK